MLASTVDPSVAGMIDLRAVFTCDVQPLPSLPAVANAMALLFVVLPRVCTPLLVCTWPQPPPPPRTCLWLLPCARWCQTEVLDAMLSRGPVAEARVRVRVVSVVPTLSTDADVAAVGAGVVSWLAMPGVEVLLLTTGPNTGGLVAAFLGLDSSAGYDMQAACARARACSRTFA